MGGCTKKPRRARLESLPCLLIVLDHAKPGVVTRSEGGLGDLGTESVWLEEPYWTGSGRAIMELGWCLLICDPSHALAAAGKFYNG
jgi:hypothetical protein